MQPGNAVLPGRGFVAERLLAPRQAMVAFFARVESHAPQVERVALDDARGTRAGRDRLRRRRLSATRRVRPWTVSRSLAAATPGDTCDRRRRAHGRRRGRGACRADRRCAFRPAERCRDGADAVVPIEDVRLDGDGCRRSARSPRATTSSARRRHAPRRDGADRRHALRRAARSACSRRSASRDVPVYRRPVVAVLLERRRARRVPDRRRGRDEIRDSNRYAIAASLRAMGAQPRHYPTAARRRRRRSNRRWRARIARVRCDRGDRRFVGGRARSSRRAPSPRSGEPGVVVHGLRVKPGKPTLLGAPAASRFVGLPGNPTSALMILEAVAAPIVAALDRRAGHGGNRRARLAAAAARPRRLDVVRSGRASR